MILHAGIPNYQYLRSMAISNRDSTEGWILQGNPDRFDVSKYIRDCDFVYTTVNIGAHQEDMLVGDPVFIWRAKGSSKEQAGVVAFGEVGEQCVRVGRVKRPDMLYGRGWSTGDGESSEIKVGTKIHERRLTPEDGMLTREVVAAHEILRDTALIKTRTGSSFRLNHEQFHAFVELWEGALHTVSSSVQ